VNADEVDDEGGSRDTPLVQNQGGTQREFQSVSRSYYIPCYFNTPFCISAPRFFEKSLGPFG